MILFLTLTLCISALALTALLMIKRWESARGRVFLRGVRPSVGAALGQGLHFVERQAPSLLLKWVTRGYRFVRIVFHRLTAWAVLHAERLLERVLSTLRGATQERGSAQASPFLREVAEHKRSLIASSKKPNAIYEE